MRGWRVGGYSEGLWIWGEGEGEWGEEVEEKF